MITLQDIQDAQQRISDIVIKTPIKAFDRRLFLKLENHQPVVKGFKIRGAANAMKKNRSPSVMTSALGTHGFAVGYVGKQLGVHTTCMMITNPPPDAEEKMKELVDDVFYGAVTFAQTEQMAVEYAKTHAIPFIHPYNDQDVIAGQGTIGLELLEQIQNIETVYVPIGGGGLISGIAVAMKSLAPEVEIVGVQPECMHAMVDAVERGTIKPVPLNPSLAEKLAVNLNPQTITFDIVRRFVDRFVTPTENEIQAAMREIYETTGEIVEGAGAIALAAAQRERSSGRVGVCIVSGGNISSENFKQATGIVL